MRIPLGIFTATTNGEMCGESCELRRKFGENEYCIYDDRRIWSGKRTEACLRAETDALAKSMEGKLL